MIEVTSPQPRTIALEDGRKVSYAEFGDPNGHPVLYCHGAPSSRLEPLFITDQKIKSHGLRIIAPDRPGIGGSEPVPHASFATWAKNAQEIADKLSLDRIVVMGNSGGTGYALAVAHSMPDRVRRTVLVSSAWRMDSPAAKQGL